MKTARMNQWQIVFLFVTASVPSVRSSLFLSLNPEMPEKQVIFKGARLALNWTTNIQQHDMLWCYWSYYNSGLWKEFHGYNVKLQQRMNLPEPFGGWEFGDPAKPCLGDIYRNNSKENLPTRYKMIINLSNGTKFESPEAEISVLECRPPAGFYEDKNAILVQDAKGIPAVVMHTSSDTSNTFLYLRCSSENGSWYEEKRTDFSHSGGDATPVYALIGIVVLLVFVIMLMIWLFCTKWKKLKVYRKVTTNDIEMDGDNAGRSLFVEEFGDKAVKQGESICLVVTVNMRCDKVVWYRNGTILNQFTKGIALRADSSGRVYTMMIRNATPDMSGLYRCTVKQGRQTQETSGELTVITDVMSAPVFHEIFPERIELESGKESQTFEANVVANPVPNILCEKNGHEFANTDHMTLKHEIIDKVAKLKLTLNNCSVNDACDITISATNAIKAETMKSKLVVLSPPKFIVPLQPQTVFVGHEAIFSVTLEAEPSPVIEWYLNDKLVPQASDVVTDASAHTTSVTLRLSNCKKKNSGKVMVKATNKVGEAQIDTELIVRSILPPIFIEPLKDVVHVPRDDIILSCTLRSAPKSQVTWFRDGSALLCPDHMKTMSNTISDDITILTLFISKCTLSDSGEFTVRAKNEGGVKERTAKIVVTEKPIFVQVPQKITVIEGEEVKVSAEWRGYPTPTIEWKIKIRLFPSFPFRPWWDGKENTRTDGNVSTLTIKKARLSNNGTSYVTATNEAGTVTHKFVINVIERD